MDDRWQQWPAIVLAQTPSSRHAIILTFSAVKSFFTPLTVFWLAIFQKNVRDEKKGVTCRPFQLGAGCYLSK
jgi:hypothetical protein